MKILNIIKYFIITVYWVVVMGLVSLILIITPLKFPSDISSLITTGFAGPNDTIASISVAALFIGLSMTIPPLRIPYKKFPWMHSFIKIMFIDMVIFNIGMAILNYGYEIQSSSRHTIFFTLMIIQIIICRIGMCLYFKLKPVKPIEA